MDRQDQGLTSKYLFLLSLHYSDYYCENDRQQDSYSSDFRCLVLDFGVPRYVMVPPSSAGNMPEKDMDVSCWPH